jgi:hypothetical protein
LIQSPQREGFGKAVINLVMGRAMPGLLQPILLFLDRKTTNRGLLQFQIIAAIHTQNLFV